MLFLYACMYVYVSAGQTVFLIASQKIQIEKQKRETVKKKVRLKIKFKAIS